MWRVLLVDDSAFVRNLMQTALEPFGFRLEHATNGKVAVAKAMVGSWDLIFLDVVMPIMDGPAALRELRARGNNTPVVLETSVTTASMVTAAVKLGDVCYIGKPFTGAQIRAIAAKLLSVDTEWLLNPPRVLVQHIDPALAGGLRKLLPAHVAIDPSTTLAETLELAEGGRRDLVILESRELDEELVAVANLVRRALPGAGIFAISRAADPDAPWQPDEGLDGLLPPTLSDALVRGFLYPTFLCPMVDLVGAYARIAGFSGPPAHVAAFATMVGRRLVASCAHLDRTNDLCVDVERVSPDPDVILAVVRAADQALRAVGMSPAFRMTPAAYCGIAVHLDGIVVL